MARWLVKGDPEEYGFADLRRDRCAIWDGVRNALALRHLRAMRRGDEVLVYETGKVRAVVGRARVAADPVTAARDPRLTTVELAAGAPLARPVELAELRADPAFADFVLVRQGRLSVMPVTDAEWRRLLEIAER
jgi:predicted RNA-binding protein with PUA-like domain